MHSVEAKGMDLGSDLNDPCLSSLSGVTTKISPVTMKIEYPITLVMECGIA